MRKATFKKGSNVSKTKAGGGMAMPGVRLTAEVSDHDTWLVIVITAFSSQCRSECRSCSMFSLLKVLLNPLITAYFMYCIN